MATVKLKQSARKTSSKRSGLLRKNRPMNPLAMAFVAAVTVVSGVTAVAASQASTRNGIVIATPTGGAQLKGVVAVTGKVTPANASIRPTLLVDNATAVLSNDCVYAQMYQPGQYTLCWNSKSVADGDHTLVFNARRGNGVSMKSLPVVVHVANVTVQTGAAFFQMIDDSGSSQIPDKFIFKLTDPVKIQQARSLIGQHKIVSGIIVGSPASYNPPWHFYLNPDTISFVDAAAEVCDASISYVEQNLSHAGGSFLPGSRWCPWGVKILKEVQI